MVHAVLYMNIPVQDMKSCQIITDFIYGLGGPKFLLQLLQLIQTLPYRDDLI